MKSILKHVPMTGFGPATIDLALSEFQRLAQLNTSAKGISLPVSAIHIRLQIALTGVFYVIARVAGGFSRLALLFSSWGHFLSEWNFFLNTEYDLILLASMERIHDLILLKFAYTSNKSFSFF